MRRTFFVLCCVSFFVFFNTAPTFSAADDSPRIDARERLSLARLFVTRLKSRWSSMERQSWKNQKNILPDGEVLLLQPVMGLNFRPDGAIAGLVQNQKVLLSLRDLSDSLQLAITVSEDGKTAKGWYVREDRPFDLDGDNRKVKTAKGHFAFSSNVLLKDKDIWIPVDELGEWLDFDLGLRVEAQEIKVKTDVLLPLYARYLRRNGKIGNKRLPEASLPLGGEGYTLAALPVVDVNTSSSYRRNDGQKALINHVANVRTASDFAHGTLITQSRLDNTDQIALVRAKYSRDSLDGNLLGALHAKRVEVGDITTTQVPFGGNVEQEFGLRVTNTDSQRGFSRATTAISGQSIPGWDVELYRRNQLLAFQTVGEDGFYQFPDVDLFNDDNTFRLVFYGLQGEVKEEEVFIPFDRKLLGQGQGIYDVSLTLDERNTYTTDRLRSDNNKNQNAPSLSALYEQPIVRGVTGVFGVRSAENSLGKRDTVVSAGTSANIYETLVNASVAVDDEAGAAAQAGLRRGFGEHKVATGFGWNGAGFSAQGGLNAFSVSSSGLSAFSQDNDTDSYGTQVSVNGPLPFGDIIKARYGANAQYDFNDNGDERLAGSAALSAGYRSVSVTGGVRHEQNSNLVDDRTSAFGSLSGARGKNRLRFNTNYEIRPDSNLQSVVASYNRRVSEEIDMSFDVTRLPEQKRTEYQARLDWQAGFVRLSPSVRYNSDRDFFAGLNTQFGVVHDPSSKKFKFYDRGLSNFGLVSAFVYLDKDGDGVFNGEDEPLEDVTVLAPQNSRQEKTGADGVALFSRMTKLRLTDIYVDKESLKDPSWIPGFEGVSILPRNGYIAQVEFPIHVSGEIDGTLYARVVALPEEERSAEYKPAAPIPMRNVELRLYNDQGKVEQSVLTDSGGFYYFSNVPPGRYLMIITEESAKRKSIIRPLPQRIEIGYDGTVMFGNDIYVQTGTGDVPAEVLSDLNAYRALHSNVDFHPEMHDVVLNLGEFNSRLLMSVVWYKLRSRYLPILGGGQLFVAPTQSYADISTGKHALRVGLGETSLDEAYARCKALMARGQYCKVEIYPAAMKEARAR